MGKRFESDEELAAASALTAIMQRVADRGAYDAIMSGLSAAERAAAEDAMDRFAAEMRDAGQSGW